MTEVTVLMPVYNAEKTLRQALESILSQTYQDFELLLIDDGSTDRSAEIIRSFQDPRIRYVKNPENQKLIRTLNHGFELARGKWIARMDADDIAFPQRLEKQLSFLSRHPDVVACGTNAVRIDSRGKRLGRSRKPHGKDFDAWVWIPTPLIHPSIMIRSDIAKANPFDPTALHCEDYELWLRLRKLGHRLDNLSAPLLYYREHEGSVSQQYRQLQLKNSYQVFRRYYPSSEIAEVEFLALLGEGSLDLSARRRLVLIRKLLEPKAMPLSLLSFQLIKWLKVDRYAT